MDLITKNSEVPMVLSQMELVEQQQLEFEQADCPVRHIFGPGLYIKEITMPAGAWCLSHYHKFASMNVMLKGKLQILMGDGTTTILEAPMTFMSPPGRKAGYILEEVVWQNVFATNETDIEKLEQMYLDQTPYMIQRDKELVEQKHHLYEAEREDYNLLLNQLNMTEEQVREVVENMSDHIDLPYGNYKFQLADSPIQGKGIFATAPIKAEELIGPGRINGCRTILGRRVNHSVPPNAIMVLNGDVVNLYATRDIKGSTGGDLGEEITVDYRFTMLSLDPNIGISKVEEILCHHLSQAQ